MSHTINDPWDFMWTELEDGGRQIYGVRWADGYEVLLKEMPKQQTEAYIKRAGIKWPRTGVKVTKHWPS